MKISNLLGPIKQINVNKLKEHPENDYVDIQAENYERLKTVIKQDGIIEPIILDNQFRIISGNQRTRVAKDLKLKTVPCRQFTRAISSKIARKLIIILNEIGRRQDKHSINRLAEVFGPVIKRLSKSGRPKSKIAQDLTEKEGLKLGTSKRLVNEVIDSDKRQTIKDKIKKLIDNGLPAGYETLPSDGQRIVINGIDIYFNDIKKFYALGKKINDQKKMLKNWVSHENLENIGIYYLKIEARNNELDSPLPLPSFYIKKAKGIGV
jgi:hypothetical protein